MLFTENGVAMLSGILNGNRAIQVNISIMRVFTKLRSFYALEGMMDRKVNKLEQDVTQVFKVVFERLDNLENSSTPSKSRKRIGLTKWEQTIDHLSFSYCT